jgi:hypothetical protein
MRKGQVVTIIGVGQRGVTVTLASGKRQSHKWGATVKVPLDAKIDGDYLVLVERAELPKETK